MQRRASRIEIEAAQQTSANLRSQLLESNQALASLQQQFDQYKIKATVSDEHVLFQVAEGQFDQGDWETAARSFNRFMTHYPHSDMLAKAKQELRVAETRSADQKKQEQARAEAAKLGGATVAAIYANIERYRGKTIIRNVQCHAVETAFAEMGDYQTSCTIDTTLDSRVLYRSSRDVKLLADLPRDDAGRFSYRGLFKILDQEVEGDGIVLRFVELAGG